MGEEGGIGSGMRIIVCDAGPLIHLSEADCLDLLRPAGNLFLPHRVAIEDRPSPKASAR
jgi:hypothetical protein